MAIKNLGLAWIVVNDIKQGIRFYTEIVGMKLVNYDERFGWAELVGENEHGTRLGIAQKSDHESIQPGENAVVTLTVDDIEQARTDMLKKGANLKGDIVEIPGHVKLQMVVDQDNNHFQLVQLFH